MTDFKTQTSSRARLKNDTLGDDAIIELNKAFALMPLADFKIFAEGVVMAGGGKQPRKLEIARAIQQASSPAVVYKKACDFILAGMGLGV